ncbi:hypothetical protein SLEP1_g40668 [Rubroshorea leprosula]|uniref:BZIP domain-containing protein n=1 Tax=Rubroshorea leprosula TaxID=152421 RepID=A0AAV5L4A9_9ROSI|nr:hypothetical protein SLEP1_g40668 [Rubroshorea leprosula]
MENWEGIEDKQNSQSCFEEYCKDLLTETYEDTVWNANQQIGHGQNPDSSEFFNSSWINEGSQEATRTVEPLTAQGFLQIASGIQPLENQTAPGIQTLTQQPLDQPADRYTHSSNNIHESGEAELKLRERKRGYDRAYRERVKQKRQKLEVENQQQGEQIGRLTAEIQLMNSNLVELKGENKFLKEENILLNQRLQTQSSELDQLRNKLKYLEQLITMLKKPLKRLGKEMEDMMPQTAAMEAAVEEEKNALLTKIPNYELFGTQAIPREFGFESTNLIQNILG